VAKSQEQEQEQDWTQNQWVQLFGGFGAGLALGIVPFAGAGQQLLDRAKVLEAGTPEARRGLAVGQITGGVIAIAGGFGGEIIGGLFSASGIGAFLGVPAMVVSAGVVTGGVANVGAGIAGLMTTGSGTGGGLWTGTKSKTPAENAKGHWDKHSQDFPEYQNAAEYTKGAKEFLNNPPPTALSKVRANGDVVVYDPASDVFGVRTADGTPRTMFKPDPAEHGYPTNLDYYNAQ
jgi:hypothetical protein